MHNKSTSPEAIAAAGFFQGCVLTGVLLRSYFVFRVAFLELKRIYCWGLVYIDLVSAYA